jgi:hypothetical protein
MVLHVLILNALGFDGKIDGVQGFEVHVGLTPLFPPKNRYDCILYHLTLGLPCAFISE